LQRIQKQRSVLEEILEKEEERKCEGKEWYWKVKRKKLKAWTLKNVWVTLALCIHFTYAYEINVLTAASNRHCIWMACYLLYSWK
jgi:hypothetical protein